MNLIVRQSDTHFFHRVVAEVVRQAFPDELAFALQQHLVPTVIQANGFSSGEVSLEIVSLFQGCFFFLAICSGMVAYPPRLCGCIFRRGWDNICCWPSVLVELLPHVIFVAVFPQGLKTTMFCAICSGRVASPFHLLHLRFKAQDPKV